MKNFKLKNYVLLLFIFILLFFVACEDQTPDINASVSFTGTQFIITNNDNFNYDNAKLELNGKYVLKGYNLKAGKTYTIGMSQFADDDGNRFSFIQKPQKFSIWCDIKGGKNGFFYAEWK